MKRLGKAVMAVVLCFCLVLGSSVPCFAEGVTITAPSAILMEASTGQIIYEMDADSRRSPASITKIMTLLLIFEALEKGQIHLEDEVVTSAHAKSMGGSQVFLEEGEKQTVETLIKCIAVASGNDASVAMAEYISGSEAEFVSKMNQRAAELGMDNTNFEDCCGLTDSDNHYTTARDVAVMSRQLITGHPDVFEYTKIWMEDITHVTSQGSKNFTLSSTNKLLRQYDWITGLKTGSTSKAKFCLSATGTKDDMDMIAVVMGAPEPTGRFQDAAALLNYAYSVSDLYTDPNLDELPEMTLVGGKEERVAIAYEEEFRYLDTAGNNLDTIEKEIHIPETAEAPVQAGEAVGEAVYKLNGQKIGAVSIVFGADVGEAFYKDYLLRVLKYLLL